MKKKLVIKAAIFSIVLFFTAGQIGFAQEGAGNKGAGNHKISIGAGPEFNMNSRENFAGGFSLVFDYGLPTLPLAFGLSAAASYNFLNSAVMEAASFFRWYFPGVKHSGFFAQADLGFYYIMEDIATRDVERFPMFLGGLRAGYRLPLGQSFYLEPYGRAGYPFAFGAGLLAGIRFHKESL